MSRFKNALRLALENDGAAEAEVIAEAAPVAEVDVSADAEAAAAVATDAVVEGEVNAEPAAGETAAVETEEVVVAEAAGESDVEAVVVDEAAEPAAGDAGEAGGEPVVMSDTDNVIVDTSDSAEEAVEDANAAGAEADAIEEQKDELEEAAAGLEAIYDMMVAAQQTGGLSRQAAQMAHLAVESYTGRVGDEEPAMASLENFGGDSTRLRATQISMEQLGEKLKHYAKVVWQFILNLKNKIWEFIKGLFTAAERLKQRGEKLARLKVSGAANTDKIEIKGYAKKIAVGTKIVIDPEQGLKDCLDFVVDTTKVSDSWAKTNQELYNHVFNVASGNAKAADMQMVIEFMLPKAFKQVGDSIETKVLPGNIKFVAEQQTLNGGKIKLWKRISQVKQEANISEEAKIPVMTPAQIVNAGQEAIKLHAAVQHARDVAAKAAQQAKSLKAPTPSDSLSADDAKAAKELLNAFRTSEITQSNLTAKVCAAAVNAALVYLKVAEKSAAAYGAKAANFEDKPAAAA